MWVAVKRDKSSHDSQYDASSFPTDVHSRVSQSRRVAVEALPNIGREAHTYLHHIVSRYADLADLTIFVQGDPYDHIIRSLHTTPFEKMFDPAVGGALSPKMSILNESTPPSHSLSRLDIHGASTKVIGKQLDVYRFSPGAQYAVPRAAIHHKGLAWWQDVLKMVVDDEVNAWEIERLWMYMFGFISVV
ncbi:hypothetical protein FOA52_014737 [Chlamydomonas sp. UWO 241]|nr:hypothetical protein FOA52_014737 [Chlamydomonas sp. UWO 241]